MIGCKALGSLGALSAEHPTVAGGFCSAYGRSGGDARLTDELNAAEVKKKEYMQQYDVALAVFERSKRRAALQRRPVARAIELEYVKAYDLYQTYEEEVIRLRYKIRKQSECSNCPECSSENPTGFQGHSIPR